MQGFLLDTNVASEEMQSRPDPRVRAWIQDQPETRLFLSVITIGEIYNGIAVLPIGKRRNGLEEWLEQHLLPRFRNRILPVTQEAGRLWGELGARRRKAGKPRAAPDGLIAGTALSQDLAVVTRDVNDFAGLGLTLIDPWQL